MIAAGLVGLIVGVLGIASARHFKGESWIYSSTLIILPIIYVGFALYDGDGSIGVKEILVGLPWLLGGLATLFFSLPKSAILVGGLWILHGIFDLAHDQLFTNPGVPDWYPVACAGTDIVIGLYLLWLAPRLQQANLRKVAERVS